jgi:hypothetical protein
VLYALNTDGSIGSSISPAVSGVTAPFSGTLEAAVAKVFSLATDVVPGGTSEWVVGCSAGPGGTGNQQFVEPVYVTLSASGSSYTASASPPS